MFERIRKTAGNPESGAVAGGRQMMARFRPQFAIAKTTFGGILAPFRHPLSFLLCSLPWLIATIALNRDLVENRSWIPFLGFCCQGWHYEAATGLYILQAIAMLLFGVLWMHVVHSGRMLARDFDVARLGPRLGHLVLALLVIGLLLIISIFLLFALGHMAMRMDPDLWWGRGRTVFVVVSGLAFGWFAGRLALYLPSAATADEPLGLAEAWAKTRGQAVWILATLAPAPLLIASMKAALLSGFTGKPVEHPFALILDLAPLWTHATETDPVPGWLIAGSVVLAWLQIAFIFATLSLLHFELSDRKT